MINLRKENEAIVFEFTDNQHYLQNGKLEVPINSMIAIFDESNMLTLRKAASQDILLSARYEDFGMTKQELMDWFKTNAFANGGGSSISQIYVGCPEDTVNPATGEVTKYECEKKDQLCIVYKSEQGEYSMTKVSLNEFILENEFEDGLYVDSGGTVHGVVDPRSEWVFIDYNASGVPTTSGEVLSVNVSGFTVHNIQTAIDKKAKAVVKKVGESAEYIWDSANNKMVLRIKDELSVKINDIEFFVTDDDGKILLPNTTY